MAVVLVLAGCAGPGGTPTPAPSAEYGVTLQNQDTVRYTLDVRVVAGEPAPVELTDSNGTRTVETRDRDVGLTTYRGDAQRVVPTTTVLDSRSLTLEPGINSTARFQRPDEQVHLLFVLRRPDGSIRTWGVAWCDAREDPTLAVEIQTERIYGLGINCDLREE